MYKDIPTACPYWTAFGKRTSEKHAPPAPARARRPLTSDFREASSSELDSSAATATAMATSTGFLMALGSLSAFTFSALVLDFSLGGRFSA